MIDADTYDCVYCLPIPHEAHKNGKLGKLLTTDIVNNLLRKTLNKMLLINNQTVCVSFLSVILTLVSPLFPHTGDSKLCVCSRPEPQHCGCVCCRPPQAVSPPPAAPRPPQQSAGPHVAGSAEQQWHKGENERRVISMCRALVGNKAKRKYYSRLLTL